MSQSGQIPNALLRRVTNDNRRMATRLAQVEFRAFLAELETPRIFELDIDMPEHAAPTPELCRIDPDHPMARRLPRLSVPLGKCAWVEAPESLPVIGILCPEMPDEALRTGLRAMMRSHHQQPFARPLFICATLRPVPLLGRYGFAYDYIGKFPLAPLAPRLALRYGLAEVRDLVSAGRVWPI